jgi:hypothetical protein
MFEELFDIYVFLSAAAPSADAATFGQRVHGIVE